MNVIVIGSKGFIGNNLLNYLAGKGYVVYGADVMIDYTEKQKYFLIDGTNADFHSIFENSKFDFCINCSGAASVPDSISNPLRDYYLNTVNVFKILECIHKFQPSCKFINLSSAAVYGNPKQLPIKENAELNMLSPYGVHKYQAEQICKEFHEYFGLKTCSVRIFSAYGEGLFKQLFWDLFRKAESGNLITLYGSGNESRDFIYIKDLVRCLELTMIHSNFEADIINIANGEEVPIKLAVAIFYDLFEREMKYTFTGNERNGDPSNWVADISRLKKMGYIPGYSIDQGLRNYYNWIQDFKK